MNKKGKIELYGTELFFVVVCLLIILSLTFYLGYLFNKKIDYAPHSQISNSTLFYSYSFANFLNENKLTIGRVKGNSMKPCMSNTSTIIYKRSFREEDLHVGDIISVNNTNLRVLHSIIKIGEDEQGKYYMTEGYNNEGFADNVKVRFNEIKYVVVAIFYT